MRRHTEISNIIAAAVNLSRTATLGPVLTCLSREVAALQKYIDCNALVIFGGRVAGRFREVAA